MAAALHNDQSAPHLIGMKNRSSARRRPSHRYRYSRQQSENWEKPEPGLRSNVMNGNDSNEMSLPLRLLRATHQRMCHELVAEHWE